MRLGAEQCHALAALAAAGPDGAIQTLLTGHGFSVRMITELINGGLAALTHENMRAGGSAHAASWITDAGRDALAIEG